MGCMQKGWEWGGMRRNVGGEGGVVRLGSVEGGQGKGGEGRGKEGETPRSSWK